MKNNYIKLLTILMTWYSICSYGQLCTTPGTIVNTVTVPITNSGVNLLDPNSYFQYDGLFYQPRGDFRLIFSNNPMIQYTVSVIRPIASGSTYMVPTSGMSIYDDMGTIYTRTASNNVKLRFDGPKTVNLNFKNDYCNNNSVSNPVSVLNLNFEIATCVGGAFRDADGDGYGNSNITGYICNGIPEPGFATIAGDCFDNDPTQYPGITWYADADKDGFGNSSLTVTGCARPTVNGVVYISTRGGDCNDNNANINPTATEIFGNTIDENCDGKTTNNRSGLQFEGDLNQIVSGTFSNGLKTSEFTVEAWVRPTGNLGTFFSVKDSYALEINNNKVYLTNLNNYTFAVSTVTVLDNVWSHVAVSCVSKDITFYINGVLSNTVTMNTGPLNVINGSIYLGQTKTNFSGSSPYSGAIDELRVWNSALTATQITDRMNLEYCGSIPGMLVYYNFNEGVGGGDNTSITTIPDLSGNGYNITNIGLARTGTGSNFVVSTVVSGVTTNTDVSSSILSSVQTSNCKATVSLTLPGFNNVKWGNVSGAILNTTVTSSASFGVVAKDALGCGVGGFKNVAVSCILIPGSVTTVVGVTRATSAIFTWPSVAGSTTYCLEVYTNQNLTNLVTSICGLTTTSINLPALLARLESTSKTYYYRVAAENSIGRGPWSEVQTIVIEIESTSIFAEEQTSIDVFPNPSNGTFTIYNKGSISNFTILDLAGKSLLYGELKKGVNTIQFTPSKGMYLLKIGMLTQKLFID